MTEKEKENRIHGLALSFLGRQQIVPNLYADQIIRGYKEGYHQAEKDLKVKEVDLEEEMNKWRQKHFDGIDYILDGSGEWLERTSQLDIARHFFELGLKAKGE